MLNFSPSIMCADQGHLAEEINKLELAGATSFHMDIMDGEFVPNFALSWAQVGYCRKITNLPLEAHLMVENVMAHLPFVYSSGINKVFVHFGHPQLWPAVNDLISHGISVGLVVNPEHEFDDFRECLSQFTDVMVMRVKPGFVGQVAVNNIDKKIATIREEFPDMHIAVDGAVSKTVIENLLPWNVETFVLGTSALFGKNKSYNELMQELRIK